MRHVEVDLLDREFAGFDLREVEDVVDDLQQRHRRVFGDLQVFALIRVDRQIKREIGHPDQAIHWRSDFVAHIGQEVALEPVGAFRGALGGHQLAGRPLDLGQIDDHTDQAGRSAVGALDRGLGNLQVDLRAVLHRE